MNKQRHGRVGVMRQWEAAMNYGRCRQVGFRELGECQVKEYSKSTPSVARKGLEGWVTASSRSGTHIARTVCRGTHTHPKCSTSFKKLLEVKSKTYKKNPKNEYYYTMSK